MKQTQIILIAITFISLEAPIRSLTWQEVFEAISPDKYDFPDNAKNKNVTCWKKIYWEEYVEGDSYQSGYVQQHRKEIKIKCPL